ncbi:hypothetical protein [Rhodopirellula sp. MGV]|uniref:hypothetical protein n=1 Tax=Rhodopirellula sp. MGV TaxID=2023130 RepID=UPI001E61FD89|nr:hypothetical protein [Rhodopirellula sp. MGV]
MPADRPARVYRFKINIDLPGGYILVPDDLPISVGERLAGCWARRWIGVDVVEAREDGTLTVIWEGESRPYRMQRSDLVIWKVNALPANTAQEQILEEQRHSLREAIEQLHDSDRMTREAGIWAIGQAIAESDFKEDSKLQDDVLRALVELSLNNDLPLKDRTVFEKMITPENAGIVIEEIDRLANSSAGSNASSLLAKAVEIDTPQRALPLISHSDLHLRHSAIAIIERSDVDDDAIATQYLSDLRRYLSEDEAFKKRTQLDATLQSVPQLELNETQATEYVELAIRLLVDQPRSFSASETGIEKLGVKASHLYELIESVDAVSSYRTRQILFQYIAQIGNDRAMEHLAKRVDKLDPHTIEYVGARIERFLWKNLSDDDRDRVLATINILDKVGTRQSIAPLEKLLSKTDLKSFARKAINQIERRAE